MFYSVLIEYLDKRFGYIRNTFIFVYLPILLLIELTRSLYEKKAAINQIYLRTNLI